MEKSALIKILKSLDQKEIRSLKKFVCSPYFNTSAATTKLFNEITSFYPGFSGKKFTREHLFQKIYRSQKYNDDLFRKLVSNLIKLSKEFLFYKCINANRFRTNIYYLLELTEKGLNDLFESDFKKNINDLSRLPVIESDYFAIFSEHYRLKSLYYNINNDLKTCYESMLESGNYLMLDLMTHYYSVKGISSIVKNFLNINFSSNLLLKFGDSNTLNKNTELLKQYFPQHKNIIELFDMFGSVVAGEAGYEHILLMKQKFFESFDRLTRAQKRNFLYQLLDCTREMKDPNVEAALKLELELYRLMLKENLFTRKDGLPMQPTTFVNILNCYLNLNMTEEAAEFTATYRSQIPKEFKTSVYYYARAKILFQIGNYEKSIHSISKVNLKQLPFCYLARALVIMSYIELNDADRAYYSLDSFLHFLKSNPVVTEYQRERFKKFLNYSARIIKYLTTDKKQNIEPLRIKLNRENKKNCYGSDWLLKIMDRLNTH
jgi:hypothetical protein